MFVIFCLGFIHGEPYKLAYPYTKDKNFCGKLNKNYNYLKRQYLFQDPIITADPATVKTVCIEQCPYEGHQCINTKDGHLSSDNETECISKGTDFIFTNEKKFYAVMFRCLPASISNFDDVPGFKDMTNVFTSFVSDISQGWYILLLSAGFSIVICFLEICCFQCCGYCIVWLSILACLIAVMVVGAWIFAYGWMHFKDPLQQDKTSSYVFIGFGGFLILLDVVLAIIVISLRRRISLATKLIQESSRAIRSMCCVVCVPVFHISLFLVVTVLFIVTMVYYFSQNVSIPDDYSETRSIVVDTTSRYVILFVFLFFLWCTSFLIGLNQSTIAGAGATWFFVLDKADVPRFPVARAMSVLWGHHLGSVAIGSFLIAIVQFFRSIVLYLRKKVSKVKNPTLKAVLCCCDCCLRCCQKMVEFIAARAYVMMMMHGKSFFPSAVNALNLMLRNVLRTSVLSVISSLIILCSIFSCACMSTFCCVLFMRPDFLGVHLYKLTINYWWFLALLCFVISFVVAYLVMEVYDVLLDTIFMCFLQDEEIAQSKGSAYVPYSSNGLREYMEGIRHRGEEDVEEEEAAKKKYLDEREAKMLAKRQQKAYGGSASASAESAEMRVPLANTKTNVAF